MVAAVLGDLSDGIDGRPLLLSEGEFLETGVAGVGESCLSPDNPEGLATARTLLKSFYADTTGDRDSRGESVPGSILLQL